jgi:WD40 repeat protein
VYGDRSLFVWDLRDASKVCRCRAMHAHSGSIWDLDFVPPDAAERAGLPIDSFVTCGSDSTIRIWGLAPQDANKQPAADPLNPTKKPAPFKDLRAMAVCTDGGILGAQGQTGGGIRCLKVSPDGARVASGDRMGNLRVHTLSADMEMVTFLEAHDAEILSMDFGGAHGNLLASAARDRLIHVFDVNRNYDTVCTLDEHAAAVTAVRFAARGTRLLSSGGDKRMIFRTLVEAPDVGHEQHHAASPRLRISTTHTQRVPLNTVYDVCVDRAGRLALSAGQDNALVVWDVANGTPKRRYTAESDCTLRVRLDPTGMFAATTSSDKGIRIHDFHSGEVVCCAHGHSEPVTAIAFSPALDRLVSASGDGCIFVWQLPPLVSRAMMSRKNELLSPHGSVCSTPRAGCQRVSGAGVFAASPSPKKGKLGKPTVSDLKKIAAAVNDGPKRDDQAIAAQRSMLSALLDQALKPGEGAGAAAGGDAGDGEDAAKENVDATPNAPSKRASPAPMVKRDNWMQGEGALPPRDARDAPSKSSMSTDDGRHPGTERSAVNHGDLCITELDSRGVEARGASPAAPNGGALVTRARQGGNGEHAADADWPEPLVALRALACSCSSFRSSAVVRSLPAARSGGADEGLHTAWQTWAQRHL